MTVILTLLVSSHAQAFSNSFSETRRAMQNQLNPNLHKVNIFGTDDREPMERVDTSGNQTPYNAIGQLLSRGNGVSTAFLISRCHVLATYHGTFPKKDIEGYKGDGPKPSPEHPAFNGNLHFFVGQAAPGQGIFALNSRATPIAWGDYNHTFLPNPEDRERLRGHEKQEWAVLRLNDCLGDEVGWLELDKNMIFPRARNLRNTLIMAGYSTDRPNDTLWADKSCAAKVTLNTIWRLDCDARRGNSGSPVMYIGQDGRPKVIAVMVREYMSSAEPIPDWSESHSNSAIQIDLIYKDIMAAIERDMGPRAFVR